MRRRHFIAHTALGAAGASIAHARSLNAQAPKWQTDGAGTAGRFGILTPDFDPVPESEMWAMAEKS